MKINKLSMRKYREESGLFVVEGVRACKEAETSGFDIVQVIRAEDVGDKTFKKMSDVNTPQGILMVVRKPVPKPLASDVIVVLDGVQEPGNVGGIIRTAAAAGVGDVIILNGTADAYSPKAVRASMGGIFKVNVVTMDRAEFLSLKVHKVATGANGCPYRLYDYSVPSAIVFGNEGNGVSSDILNASDIVTIPCHMESLNVNVAAGIILFDLISRE